MNRQPYGTTRTVRTTVRDGPRIFVMNPIMKYPDGLWPNVCALLYVALTWSGGLYLITLDAIAPNLLGVLALAHGMVIASYLVHECAHNTIFRRIEANRRLGALLLWVNGSCYASYGEIRRKHFRHHVDRADVVAFDYRPKLAAHPRLLQLLNILEWLYIPAVEIVMHLLVIAMPFVLDDRRGDRLRVLAVLAIRTGLFAALAWYAPRVLLLYPLAYLLFMTVMRFMDTHQHTYEVCETLEQPREPAAAQRDRAYEQRNTFSNLFSRRHPRLNLLVLNFGYHNAHHDKPNEPWHRLPALHRRLYGEQSRQELPIGNLLQAFHRYRVARMLNGDNPDSGVVDARGRDFIGVDGVSFLTAH